MSKEWFTAIELSGKEGLPATKSGVIRAAKRGEWLSRERQKVGGKALEYHLSSLPEATQKALLKAEIEQETASKSGQEGNLAGQKVLLREKMGQEAELALRQEAMAQSIALEGKTAARDAAKHTILGLLNAYRLRREDEGLAAQRGGKYGKGLMTDFVSDYNQDRIEVDAETRAAKPRVDIASLYRWEKKLKEGKHLGGKYGHRKGSGKIDTHKEMREAIIGLLANTPHVSSKVVFDFVSAKFGDQAPSQRALERWVVSWKEAHRGLFQANANPDRWKSQNMVAYGSITGDIVRLNQRWALDSSPADVMLADGRHSLLACIDLFSRRVRFLVAKTSKAVTIAALLRRCILDWGVPEEIKTDNGQDYASLHLQRACNLLGISQNFSQPFSPWEKGNVERVFRTFSHGVMELLPGFLGHNVAEQQEIRARQAFSERLFKKNEVAEVKMTGEEFQRFCDRWADAIYAHTQHGGIGTTPFLKAQECREALRWIDNERALDMLLARAPGRDGIYKLQKKGLHIDGAWYFDAQMALYPAKTPMQVLYLPNAGEVVVYAHERPEDPLNLHATLPGLHFVCIARCPERAGMTREEHAEEAKKAKNLQTQDMQTQKKRLKEIVKDSVAKDAPEVILQAAETKASNIVAFAKAKKTHTTPGIEAAEEALKAQDREGFHPDDPGTLEGQLQRLEELRQRPKVERYSFTSAFDRAMWMFGEFMAGRKDDMDGEAWEFIREFRANHPRSVKLLDDTLDWQYMARWEEYQSYRLAVGWPETRKPKGA